jgi:outer membrane biosynthesis protein TonB
MVRVAAKLLVLLSVMALAAGGCDGEAQEAAGKGPAGRVVELSGAVSATREGAATRALARGDEIFRDDTVKTGADASVTILLGHNKARWSLSGSQARRVDRSAAWRAEPGSGSGSAFDDDDALPTSSAGRHSEPQAGDTRATAPTPPAAPADETRVAESGADDAAEPPPVTRGPRRKKRSEERAKGDAPAAAPADTTGLALGAAPMPPGAGGGGAAPSEKDPDSSGTGSRGAPLSVSGGKRAVLAALRVSGARKRAELSETLSRGLDDAAQLCSLAATEGGTILVSFDIGRKGDVARVRVKGPSGLVKRVGGCLRKQVEELSFAPRKEGTTRVRQSIRFAVP